MKQTTYDLLVVGGGHAGIEAANIGSLMGLSTLIVTMDPLALGRMSCNPAIGGLAKGQMVREVDVLGGVMGWFADQCGLQFKVLNKTKGRAVWSPRAQVDKRQYEKLVVSQIKKSPIKVFAGEVVSLLYVNSEVSGAVLRSGEKIKSKNIIITAGTFLSGLIHIGERKINAGRMGEERALGLTEHLCSVGFKSGRLKTGTPPRINKNSVDWSKTSITLGDDQPIPFSYSTKRFNPPNEPCHIVGSNKKSHDIISKNKHRSPMFSGEISGTGPRYCPSIEDKIERFPDRESHLFFLEPEWKNSDQIYLNGFSTSLPESVQRKSLRAIPGLEKVEFFRPGYAIEYDFFPPSQLKNTLETKDVDGLFFAGQMNGTSGYEEAAAQGLICGINAALRTMNKDPLVLTRSSSYIGVMIDDLITKDTIEPYRMFTSRAEHRLVLRYSNTIDRLLGSAVSCGSLNPKKADFLNKVLNKKNDGFDMLNGSVLPNEMKELTKLKQSIKARGVLKRSEVAISDLPGRLTPNLSGFPVWLKDDILYDIETEIKYEGYVKRSMREINSIKKKENIELSKNTVYSEVSGLSSEAIEKLSTVRPQNLGQAMRISGITPADISVLSIYLSKKKSFT